jgi:hypothetical protein
MLELINTGIMGVEPKERIGKINLTEMILGLHLE